VVGIALSIAFSGLLLAAAIVYIGFLVNKWAEVLEYSSVCYLAILRTQLRAELEEMEHAIPEWLDDIGDEAEIPRGKVLSLVKRDKGEEHQ
jgi:hypothetical protein